MSVIGVSQRLFRRPVYERKSFFFILSRLWTHCERPRSSTFEFDQISPFFSLFSFLLHPHPSKNLFPHKGKRTRISSNLGSLSRRPPSLGPLPSLGSIFRSNSSGTLWCLPSGHDSLTHKLNPRKTSFFFFLLFRRRRRRSHLRARGPSSPRFRQSTSSCRECESWTVGRLRRFSLNHG